MLKDREEELSARQYHWQQCEMKAEATIAQQIKLIDFLQTKAKIRLSFNFFLGFK